MGVITVPGLQTWGFHHRPPVAVGRDPPPAKAGAAGTGQVSFEQHSWGGGLRAGPVWLTALLHPSAEKPVFFPAFVAEGQKLPTDPSCWTSGLPFPVPPREVIKASPHAPDPLAFSYAPPGE